ncbi:MAG: hypothetical protein ABEJ67_01900 [Halanaeroarchaeum sp.]
MAPPRKPDDVSDDSVLSPEELDITGEKEVEELDEGRFVIGAEGRPNVEAAASPDREDPATTIDRAADEPDDDDRDASSATRQSRTDREAPDRDEISGRDVKRWITAELDRTDSQYAYRIAAKTGEHVSHQQMASDDIGMAFDGLLMWYAQQVGGGTPVEEALGILLAESNIRVRYPVAGMLAYLEEHDLDPEDSIADLLEEIRDNDGLVFPLRHRR